MIMTVTTTMKMVIIIVIMTYICEAVEACPKLDRVNDRLGEKKATQLTLKDMIMIIILVIVVIIMIIMIMIMVMMLHKPKVELTTSVAI